MVTEINDIVNKIDEMTATNFKEKGKEIKDVLEVLILRKESLLQIRHHLETFPRLKKLLCVTCPKMDDCDHRGKSVVTCGEKQAELWVPE